MTEKNRGRLRPFDDPEMVGKFLALPDAIRASVVRDKQAPVSKALLAQIAAAIALVQAVPMRRKNLAGIDMNRHLVPQRDRLYLVIPEAETKNRQAINLLLPRFTQEVLAWYVRGYRPLLVRAPTTALFPGEGAGPKAAHTIGIQIAETVKTFLGIDFNTHMFRHVAGKIYLDKNPGAYEVVRQVLRHKSINTTTSFYTGAETRAANELYTSLVDDLRATYQANPYRGAAL
jgi:integrase